MKRISFHPTTKTFASGKSDVHKQPGRLRVNNSHPKSDQKHDSKDGDSTHDQSQIHWSNRNSKSSRNFPRRWALCSSLRESSV